MDKTKIRLITSIFICAIIGGCDIKPSTPVAHGVAQAEKVDSAALRLTKAKDHWPEIKEQIKRRCKHPLTAEVSDFDAQWISMDSTNENVAVQGKGSCKNSFRVPDEFTYTAYIFVTLGGQDSIYAFEMH